MDIQQRLIDLANKKSRITNEDEILMNAMTVINEFIDGIDKGVDKENFDSANFSAHTSPIRPFLKIDNKTLGFKRENDFISVRNNNEDKLKIINGEVISEKYDIPLSNELLEKYSDFFF